MVFSHESGCHGSDHGVSSSLECFGIVGGGFVASPVPSNVHLCYCLVTCCLGNQKPAPDYLQSSVVQLLIPEVFDPKRMTLNLPNQLNAALVQH